MIVCAGIFGNMTKEKCDYGFFKVVPKVHCDKKAIEEILNAQHWVWI